MASVRGWMGESLRVSIPSRIFPLPPGRQTDMYLAVSAKEGCDSKFLVKIYGEDTAVYRKSHPKYMGGVRIENTIERRKVTIPMKKKMKQMT
jgi:hypothetical protein